ncbi:MAG: glycosyl hydrolase [Sedimentisphaeraceae bacterium JB056]
MSKKVIIKNDEVTKKFLLNWRKCIGTGHLGLALRQEYQNSLSIIQDEIGFDYIRGHGLFSDPVGIYRGQLWKRTEDPLVKCTNLNFIYLDMIYDSFLDKGIRPFVELGFMPNDLASGEETIFWWKGNVTPPKDYGEWKRLVKGFVSHLLCRYGREEVLKWPFEVWNEPDCSGFWSGTQEEYFRLYRETVSAIKEIDQDLHVGGPATCPAGINWITPFLEMCDKENVPVDFVSTHSYAAKSRNHLGELTYQDMHSVAHSLNQFRDARQRIQKSSFSNLPLHITEYNTSYSARSPIHDTALNAAFLGYLLSHGGDVGDSYSYWTFSDMFEEEDVPKAMFHGGFGLLGFHGIRKPTFHLFAFFSKLGDELLYKDENMVVTRRADKTIILVAWNPVVTRDVSGETSFTIDIPMSIGKVFVKNQRVNEEYGNAWSCWRKLGRPRFSSKEQVDTLHQAPVPKLETKQDVTENGCVQINLKLQRNEICLVEIQPVEDDSWSYVGLDDKKIPGY